MTSVIIKPETFGVLKDKVVVITGGTTGIGAVAVTELLCTWNRYPRHQTRMITHLPTAVGAKVVLGDIKPSEVASTVDNFTFVHTDVSEYDSVVNLFATAYATHARIDHVISNAGVVEIDQLFATADSDE
jgi:NAD(P)-dependent dehydrogenase (short-subunit alcohol dehydrogenase family)